MNTICNANSPLIRQFIENLVRPYVTEVDLEAAYRLMAADEEREADALEWSESLIGDIPTEDSFDKTW